MLIFVQEFDFLRAFSRRQVFQTNWEEFLSEARRLLTGATSHRGRLPCPGADRGPRGPAMWFILRKYKITKRKEKKK